MGVTTLEMLRPIPQRFVHPDGRVVTMTQTGLQLDITIDFSDGERIECMRKVDNEPKRVLEVRELVKDYSGDGFIEETPPPSEEAELTKALNAGEVITIYGQTTTTGTKLYSAKGRSNVTIGPEIKEF